MDRRSRAAADLGEIGDDRAVRVVRGAMLAPILTAALFAASQSAPPSAPGQTRAESVQAGPSQEGSAEEQIELHRRADAALRRRDFPAARELFHAAMALDPGNGAYAYGLACCQEGVNRVELTLDWLECAAELGYRDAAVAREDFELRYLWSNERFNELFPRGGTPIDETRQWFLGNQRAIRLTADPAGTWAAVAHPNRTIDVVALPEGELRVRVGKELEPALALASSPDGEHLASLHADGKLAVWSASTGEMLSPEDSITLARSFRAAPRLSYAAGGARIVATTTTGVALWDASGRPVETDAGRRPRSWSFFASSASGKHIAHGELRSVHLVDLLDGERRVRTVGVGQFVSATALSPDGELLAVGSERGMLRLVEVATGEERWCVQITDELTGSGQDAFGGAIRVGPIRFSPSGARISAGTTTGFYVATVDVSSGKRLWQSKHLGGRMGATLPLEVNDHVVLADDGAHGFDPATGRTAKGWAVADRRYAFESSQGRSRGPGIAATEAGLLVPMGHGFELVDSRTGELIAAYACEAPRAWVRHPAGWVSGDTTGVEVDPRHFDPRRMRAARKGVPLAPAPR